MERRFTVQAEQGPNAFRAINNMVGFTVRAIVDEEPEMYSGPAVIGYVHEDYAEKIVVALNTVGL